jgi:hypothetical protein
MTLPGYYCSEGPQTNIHNLADHYIAYSTGEYYMRELILVIASVSIILWEPVFAAPEIADGLLH